MICYGGGKYFIYQKKNNDQKKNLPATYSKATVK
jgi:hypothetical protein